MLSRLRLECDDPKIPVAQNQSMKMNLQPIMYFAE